MTHELMLQGTLWVLLALSTVVNIVITFDLKRERKYRAKMEADVSRIVRLVRLKGFDVPLPPWEKPE